MLSGYLYLRSLNASCWYNSIKLWYQLEFISSNTSRLEAPVTRLTRMTWMVIVPRMLWDPYYALLQYLLGVTNIRNVFVVFELLELVPPMFQFSSRKNIIKSFWCVSRSYDFQDRTIFKFVQFLGMV